MQLLIGMGRKGQCGKGEEEVVVSPANCLWISRRVKLSPSSGVLLIRVIDTFTQRSGEHDGNMLQDREVGTPDQGQIYMRLKGQITTQRGSARLG